MEKPYEFKIYRENLPAVSSQFLLHTEKPMTIKINLNTYVTLYKRTHIGKKSDISIKCGNAFSKDFHVSIYQNTHTNIFRLMKLVLLSRVSPFERPILALFKPHLSTGALSPEPKEGPTQSPMASLLKYAPCTPDLITACPNSPGTNLRACMSLFL